jgi:hypothetical protein
MYDCLTFNTPGYRLDGNMSIVRFSGNISRYVGNLRSVTLGGETIYIDKTSYLKEKVRKEHKKYLKNI